MTYSIILQACVDSYRHLNLSKDERWCNATWDMVSCWPPTPAGEIAQLPCPPHKGVDPRKYVYKQCDVSGRWAGKTAGDFSQPQGWTNYTVCFYEEIQKLMRDLYRRSEDDAQRKWDIAHGTRIMEMLGLSLSLASLCISLAIFFYFRSLKNNRTRIHRNLFVAILIQVMIRLVVYIDQAITRGNISGHAQPNTNSSWKGIDNTPVLCEASYVLLEYARTAMFMWMFIEGLYLHNKITVTVFQHRFYYSVYHAVGWGVPILMTAAWATVTGVHFGHSGNFGCWWGYNFTWYFWILEGPRLTVISLNMIFLLNIIRVLVTKLRQSNSSEALQVRKAVKAAIVLLPLLGITNVLNMIATPISRSVFEFGLWSYATHFLTSFQGFFIAMLYCFLNGEVRAAVRKYVDNYLLHRSAGVRRGSGMSSVFLTTVTDLPRDPAARSRALCSCLRGTQSPTHGSYL